MLINEYNCSKYYTDAEDAKGDKSGSCYQLLINFDKEYVETNCGDFYYDYSISFDDFIKIADYIKSRRRNETKK